MMMSMARIFLRRGAHGVQAGWCAATFACLAMLASCGASGDFGRVRPSLIPDSIHDWLGRNAAEMSGRQPSGFNLTEDERLLRDLAYPLIEPPYDRQRWYSVLGEFGITRIFNPAWWYFDRVRYTRQLMRNTPMLGDEPILLNRAVFGPTFRSTTGRYAQLTDDVRNDIVRIPPFFVAARRVLDLDVRRQKSLSYIPSVTPAEGVNALNRVAENALIVGWVLCSLDARADAYRFALERLVISEPARVAVEAEQALMQMQQGIARNRIVPPPPFCLVAAPYAVPAGGVKITK
jgi:hypothetical protein